MSNPYRILGLGLCLAGAIFAPISYFIISSVPLTAVGISTLIVGFVCIVLANTQPYISPEASELMLQTGMENIAALLEELGLRSKAIYLPSTMRDGHSQALVPLVDGREIQLVKGKIPGRLIVRYGANPDDIAIAVTMPIRINIDMLETKPGPTSDEMEAVMADILIGVLDIASSVTVQMTDARIDVEVNGSKLHYEDIWYYQCLGSPMASIVAALSCEALGKPVRLREESFSKGKSSIALEVLS